MQQRSEREFSGYIAERTRARHVRQLARVVVAAAALAWLAGCGGSSHPNAANGEKSSPTLLRRGLGGEPGSLDPAAAIDTFSMEVLGDLYEGLTSEAADGTVGPGVASSWEVDKTGLTYTFHLRPDAKWSNGQPVRASDFVTAWRRVVDPKTGSGVADNLRLIAGAEAIIAGRKPAGSLGVFAPTDAELKVELAKPAPFFYSTPDSFVDLPDFFG